MTDAECVEVLTWAMPQLGLRWRGFEYLRRQVCRRVRARVVELGLDAREYRARLEDDPTELARLDALCYVTISRFYRDADTFDWLVDVGLPRLAARAVERGDSVFRIWSAGCASGEEPYSLAILWRARLAEKFPSLTLDVLATDFDATVLARAARATFERGSLAELPNALYEIGFEGNVVRPEIRLLMRFEQRDIRVFTPDVSMDIALCRNVAFTYFDIARQLDFVERVAASLVPGGMLVVGGHESLPSDATGFAALTRHVYEREAGPAP